MSTPHRTIVYIISAPSGSGKSTLVNELLKEVPNLDFSISYTTRAPRGSERNGKQYHFVPRGEFERMMRDDQFLEYADVFGNCYGTARRFLTEAEQNGHDLLLDIDVQGAAQIQRKLADAVTIFVLPPDKKTLERRLRKRGEDREDVIRRRLDTATREIEQYDKYNYILINDRLEQSVESLQAIVLAERLRHSSHATLSDEESKTVNLADGLQLRNVKDRIQPILASFREPPSAQP
jgi:guanylate kinase